MRRDRAGRRKRVDIVLGKGRDERRVQVIEENVWGKIRRRPGHDEPETVRRAGTSGARGVWKYLLGSSSYLSYSLFSINTTTPLTPNLGLIY